MLSLMKLVVQQPRTELISNWSKKLSKRGFLPLKSFYVIISLKRIRKSYYIGQVIIRMLKKSCAKTDSYGNSAV